MNECGAAVEWYWQGKLKCWGKDLPSATVSTTNATWTDLGPNSILAVRGRRLAARVVAKAGD